MSTEMDCMKHKNVSEDGSPTVCCRNIVYLIVCGASQFHLGRFQT